MLTFRPQEKERVAIAATMSQNAEGVISDAHNSMPLFVSHTHSLTFANIITQQAFGRLFLKKRDFAESSSSPLGN